MEREGGEGGEAQEKKGEGEAMALRRSVILTASVGFEKAIKGKKT